MKIWRDMKQWRSFRRKQDVKSMGFVPTMGGLHGGHESLVKRCREENDLAVVSLFLNPTQFDQSDDLKSYPAQLTRDLGRLELLAVDHVLLPDYESLYPDDYRYRVSETQLSGRYCGAHREGHFYGVLTVVLKLLNLVDPRRAYFGEKDYQQLILVRGMVEALFLEVDIVACPTVRESSGLALSTRNERLDQREREQAAHLNRSLIASGSPAQAARSLESHGFRVEYVEDFHDRRLAAVWLGEHRLIDNVPLEVCHAD